MHLSILSGERLSAPVKRVSKQASPPQTSLRGAGCANCATEPAATAEAGNPNRAASSHSYSRTIASSVEPSIEERRPSVTPSPIRIAPTEATMAVLGLFLEVISMQLTPQLQMGAIRAQTGVADCFASSAFGRGAQCDSAADRISAWTRELDADGRISVLRLLPTSKPFQPAQTRNAFEIGGVALIPNDTRARVQLTPAGTTPMTMELLRASGTWRGRAHPTFQVAQLILKWPHQCRCESR